MMTKGGILREHDNNLTDIRLDFPDKPGLVRTQESKGGSNVTEDVSCVNKVIDVTFGTRLF